MLLGVMKSFNGRDYWPDLPAAADGSGLARLAANPLTGPSEKVGRPMMLAAVYMAATGRTTLDGFEGDLAAIFRNGIAETVMRAVGPPDGSTQPCKCDPGTQLALLLAWEFLGEPLDVETKTQLAEHLRTNRVYRNRDTNWFLFHITQGMVLQRMGEPYDRDDAEDALRQILNMYRGDGWFIDGWNQQFDCYNFWGFQLYLHLLMCEDEVWRARYGPLLEEITALHEQTIPYWMDAAGDLIGHGRSLSYRFAAVCGIQWAQKSGLGTLSPGLARRISSGCIKSFVEQHGCLRDDGTLPIGFWGENTTVGEDYTDTGSPYWAATGLMALTLPEDHPFWTEPELPSPSDSAEASRIAVRGAQMSLKTGGSRREARMYIAGGLFRHAHTWEAGGKYFQHAYSSTLGFAMTGLKGLELSVGRTGISPDGETWVYRTKPRMLEMSPAGCRSEWNPGLFHEGFEGRVVTESFFLDEGELHVFTHFSKRAMFLRLGGWSVRLQGGDRRESPRIRQDDDGMFSICSDFNTSVILSLPEFGGMAGRVECMVQEPRAGFSHTHLFGGIGCWPQWTSAEPVAPGQTVAVFVDAARNTTGITAPVPDNGRLLKLARSVRFDEGIALRAVDGIS